MRKKEKEGVCPNCGEEGLEYGVLEPQDEMIFYPVECNKCHWDGNEWYTIKFNGFNT